MSGAGIGGPEAISKPVYGVALAPAQGLRYLKNWILHFAQNDICSELRFCNRFWMLRGAQNDQTGQREVLEGS